MNGNDGFPAPLGILVRERRRARGLTQHELAVRAGLSLAAVRDLEQGRTRRPQPGSLAGLAAALGLSLAQAGEPEGALTDSGLRLHVLGPLVARRNGTAIELGGARRRAVLGLLALSAGSLVHREAIIDMLWPDDPPASALNLIQVYVSRLRRLIDPEPRPPGGHGLLVSAGSSYRFQAGPDELDLLNFGRLLTDARASCSRGDGEAGCSLYQQALELWRGEPLAEVDLLRGHPEVTRLSRQRAQTVIEYADVAFQAGSYDRVLGPLRELAARERLNELAHAQLMVALAGSGQQAEALAVYYDLCRSLDEQLGMPPGRELAEAHQRVLRQDVPPARAGHAAVTVAAGARAASQAPSARGTGDGPAGPLVPRQLTAAPESFVGREAELSALDSLLDATQETVVISAIGGTAGVGKTALAVHWSHRVAAEFPDGQLYVNLRGFDPSAAPVLPSEVLGWFLGALGVAADGMPASAEARAGLFRSLAAGKRLLVVLDNARDADQVRPLLPGSAGCLVLVTSRARLSGLAAGEGARLLSLDVLSEAEARQMLASRVGAGRAAVELDAVDELIGLCARLPLALAVMAGRAAGRPELALADLAAELAESSTQLDVLEAGDAASSLRAVLSCSYTQVTPEAARMFRLLGLHPGPDITTIAAASLAGITLSAARQVLAELTAASLLTEHLRGRFAFHDLLRAYAAGQARATECDQARTAAQARVFDHYVHTAQAAVMLLYQMAEGIDLPPPRSGVTVEQLDNPDQAVAWFEAEQQVLRAATFTAARDGPDSCAWRLAWAFGSFVERKGQYEEQAAICRAGLGAAERLGDAAGQASIRRMLAHNSARRGDHEQAHAYLAPCLELYQQLGDSEGQGRLHQSLGYLYLRQGRLADATAHFHQALELHRRPGREHDQSTLSNIGYTLNALAWTYAQMGELDRAEELGQQAVSLHTEFGLSDSGYCWDTLGYITAKLGRHGEAARCYQQAITIFRRQHRRFHEADALNNLGDAWHAAGQQGSARHAWQQALLILDDLRHPGASQVRAKLRGEEVLPWAAAALA
jgi:DNA-binding SARP family transcriptional activator/Tfp pilus assembly protein PilF/DNA-binding XRE family transcriptional regulator